MPTDSSCFRCFKMLRASAHIFGRAAPLAVGSKKHLSSGANLLARPSWWPIFGHHQSAASGISINAKAKHTSSGLVLVCCCPNDVSGVRSHNNAVGTAFQKMSCFRGSALSSARSPHRGFFCAMFDLVTFVVQTVALRQRLTCVGWC